eukprot:2480330-Pyramimonas_sp.AAC.1
MACLGVCLGTLNVRLVSAHLLRSESPDGAYDETLMILGDIVEQRGRGGANVVGLDANAVI